MYRICEELSKRAGFTVQVGQGGGIPAAPAGQKGAADWQDENKRVFLENYPFLEIGEYYEKII